MVTARQGRNFSGMGTPYYDITSPCNIMTKLGKGDIEFTLRPFEQNFRSGLLAQ